MFSAYAAARKEVAAQIPTAHISAERLMRKIIAPSEQGHVCICLKSVPKAVAQDICICVARAAWSTGNSIAHAEITDGYANFELSKGFFLYAVKQFNASLAAAEVLPTIAHDTEYALVRMNMLSRKPADTPAMLELDSVRNALWQCFALAESGGNINLKLFRAARAVLADIDRRSLYNGIGEIAQCCAKLISQAYI